MTSVWSSVIGQDHAVSLLRQLTQNPVHGYLFIGPEGCGKDKASRAFASCLVTGSDGSIIGSEIARIEVRQGAARISRESGGRSVAIKVNLRDRDQGSFVAEAQAKVAAAVPLPPGYSMTWGGQFENQQRAAARLALVVPVALAAGVRFVKRVSGRGSAEGR